MKVYLSGPISGLTKEEYTELFRRARQVATELGHEVVNPLEVNACADMSCVDLDDPPEGQGLHSWQCYLRYDLKEMLDCQAIAMLPGFEESRGANLELYVAEAVGMVIFTFRADFTLLKFKDGEFTDA